MKLNIADIVVIIILIIAVIASIVVIRRNKGKCAYCNHSDTCPFRKVINDDK